MLHIHDLAPWARPVRRRASFALKRVTPPASARDVFADGLFPVCAATHDLGVRRLFDLATLLLVLDCRPGDLVLDLGAGSGFSSEMLARLGYDVVALDPDRQALSHNRTRQSFDAGRIDGIVRLSSGVAEHLPFMSAVFDGVLGMNVLHHVPRLSLCVSELARVLKPGARAVFVEPGLDHLDSLETQRAIQEYGETDRAFDVLELLRIARESGFAQAMLTATLQPPLRLLPFEEIETYRAGEHRRPHLTPAGVLNELERKHAYTMLVRAGEKAKTSAHPGVLACVLHIGDLPRELASGQSLSVQVAVTNTGDTTWIAQPSPRGGFVTLGWKVLTDERRLVTDRVGRAFLPHDVPPGETVRLTLSDTVPVVPAGDYRLLFDMVDELICWFSDVSASPPLTRRVRIV